jgi:hypothetical protein
MRKTLVLDDPLSACTSRFVDGSNTREKEERCSNAWAPVYCDHGPRREIARLGESRVFVELACGYHARFYEISRQLSAFEIARKAFRNRYPMEERDIRYTEAIPVNAKLPVKFKAADLVAPCGCRAWYWRGL